MADTSTPMLGATSEYPSFRRIASYDILDQLGEGGMGTVYKVRHRHLNKIFALKLIHEDRIKSAKARERFFQEWRAVGAVKHANVVEATDAGIDQGRQYLVMEYLEGIDLAHFVAHHGPLPVGAACELIQQAALGLGAIEKAGLVHRDIKPSNLFLATQGQVKILDLGLARLLDVADEDSRVATSSHQAMGTADYMAPEQGQSAHDVDNRADIYSLGCTLYFLLAGRPPFADRKTFVQKMMAHAQAPFPALKGFRSDVPDALAQILERMTQKQVEQRFESATLVAHALKPFIHREGEQSAIDKLIEKSSDLFRSMSEGEAKADTVQREHTDRQPIPPHPVALRMWFAAGGAAVSLALVAFILVNVIGGSRPDHPSPDKKNDAKQNMPEEVVWAETALNGMPETLLWPEGSSWVFQKEENRIELTPAKAYEPSLIKLHKVEQGSFQFSVKISQTDWNGGPGIFWGHSESARGICFQFLALRSPGDGRLELSRGWYQGSATSVGAAVAKPDKLFETLEIKVIDNILVDIRWGGKVVSFLNDLSPDMAFQLKSHAESHPAQGNIGLFGRMHGGVFLAPKLFLLQRRTP